MSQPVIQTEPERSGHRQAAGVTASASATGKGKETGPGRGPEAETSRAVRFCHSPPPRLAARRSSVEGTAKTPCVSQAPWEPVPPRCQAAGRTVAARPWRPLRRLWPGQRGSSSRTPGSLGIQEAQGGGSEALSSPLAAMARELLSVRRAEVCSEGQATGRPGALAHSHTSVYCLCRLPCPWPDRPQLGRQGAQTAQRTAQGSAPPLQPLQSLLTPARPPAPPPPACQSAGLLTPQRPAPRLLDTQLFIFQRLLTKALIKCSFPFEDLLGRSVSSFPGSSPARLTEALLMPPWHPVS